MAIILADREESMGVFGKEMREERDDRDPNEDRGAYRADGQRSSVSEDLPRIKPKEPCKRQRGRRRQMTYVKRTFH